MCVPISLALPLPQHYAIIDIETTGGDPRKDRITEIAIYRYDGQQVTDSFTSLINPEVPIPDRITYLTGIDNDMVKDAPRFYEVARQIVEITEGSIFVAHNARFDYGFIQKEFRSLGYTFSRKMLCTLKLARKRLPGLQSYSLKNLCRELGITNEASHRAFGDAKATLVLLQQLLQQQETGLDNLSLEMASAKIPPNLPRSKVEVLPDAIGVYYFYDQHGNVLYTGKSNSIRKRVLSHFQAAYKTKRGMRLFEQIHDLGYELTGSELVALLLENEEIKRLLPPYNRAQRRRSFRYAVYADVNEQGYHFFWVDKLREDPRAVACFSSRVHAESSLRRAGEEYELCPKLYGMEAGPGRCFHHQLHLCRGACIGEEPPEVYNQRCMLAIAALNYGQTDKGNYLIIDRGRNEHERAVVCLEKGVYQGYTYVDLELLQASPAELRTLVPFKAEAPDVQRIIQGFLRRNRKKVQLVSF